MNLRESRGVPRSPAMVEAPDPSPLRPGHRRYPAAGDAALCRADFDASRAAVPTGSASSIHALRLWYAATHVCTRETDRCCAAPPFVALAARAGLLGGCGVSHTPYGTASPAEEHPADAAGIALRSRAGTRCRDDRRMRAACPASSRGSKPAGTRPVTTNASSPRVRARRFGPLWRQRSGVRDEVDRQAEPSARIA